ncbi:MAG: site-2 protease family protein [Armatimonadetes bacterium]|nr:site-2 protease family protein [Armatimonadota bacterium]
MTAPVPSLWFVLFLYPALFVAVTVHEVGHALFARAAGYAVTSVGLGASRPLFSLTLPGGTRFFLCCDNPTLGTCWTTTPELLPSRRARALLFVGGGAANLIVAFLSFFWWRDFGGGGVVLALFVMNALLGVMNLLPLRVTLPGSGGAKAVASDGLQATSLFLVRRVRVEPPQTELGFQLLWQSVGDTRTEGYRLCLAGLAAIEGGDVSSAAVYSDAANALPPNAGSDAHRLFLRARVALTQGGVRVAGELLAGARELYDAQNATGSVFLCDLHRLFTLPGAEAVAAWEMLASAPFAKRGDRATPLAATRLLLWTRNDGSNAGTLETLLARYEAARRVFRSDADDTRVYEAVARWRETHGDAVGAQIARERT